MTIGIYFCIACVFALFFSACLGIETYRAHRMPKRSLLEQIEQSNAMSEVFQGYLVALVASLLWPLAIAAGLGMAGMWLTERPKTDAK
jgi:predicted membrane-bound spermidine synthase